jgi:hypothetical protein
LEPLGINNYKSNITKLLAEEFIYGLKPGVNGTRKRSNEEIKLIEEITTKISNNYDWNVNKSFVWVASQNCSDMLVLVG